jgi:hypothetical protein
VSVGSLNQRHFSIGELDPTLAGFTDVNFYKSALKRARNVQTKKNASLQNRPGTLAVLPNKFPLLSNREIPFKISFNQQYDLVLGNNYMHFVKNGQPIWANTGNLELTNIPNASNPTITINQGSSSTPALTTANFANGMMIKFRTLGESNQMLGNTVLNDQPDQYFQFFSNLSGRFFILANVTISATTTTFTVTDLYGNQINSTGWGTFGAGHYISVVYEVPTPYASTDLYNIKFAQSFDIMQLRHKLYPPQELSYTNDQSWSLTRKYYWPTQVQYAEDVAGTGGATGVVNTYYKVSTYNLTTEQESLPAPIAPGSPINSIPLVTGSIAGTTVALITSLPHGLVPGDVVQFSIPTLFASFDRLYYTPDNVTYYGAVSKTPTSYTLLAGTGGTTLILTADGGLSDTGNLVLITGAGTNTTNLSQASLILPSPILPNQIVSLSSGNPMLVTVTQPIGLTAGQEVLLNGTNVFGIDGLTFNAIPITSTTFYLIGVDGANYDLTTFTSAGSSITTTTIVVPNVTPTGASPITISGSVTTTIAYQSNILYLIYRSSSPNGNYGFIGECIPTANSNTFSFVDPGLPPDPTEPPKQYLPIFIGAGNYPSACNFYQERLVELATINNFQGLWASVIADYNDFTVHNPIQANDAILINIWSTEMSQIFDSADDSFLILMTDMGPMVAAGDSSGVFSPSSDLIKRYMFAGSAPQPRPLTLFKDVLYVEASQQSIRDLEILTTPYYTYISESHDISLMSAHLLQQSPVVAWDYKLYPDSQVYMVRADGKMICNTFFKEGQLNTFTWFDTLGLFKDIACVQELTETTAYVLANRTSFIGVEKFVPRDYSDNTIDAIFTDCTSVYNGKINTTDPSGNSTACILSGTPGFENVITATFPNTTAMGSIQVGWQVNFRYQIGVDENNDPIWVTARIIVTSVSASEIVGTAMENFNSGMIGVMISDIRVANNQISGLWNLNGQQVSVVADGIVVSNPNDSAGPTLTVVNGSITTLQAHGIVNTGLPYYSDLQTLAIDSTQSETLMDKFMGVPKVTFKLYQTGDLLIGPNFTENLPVGVKMDFMKHRSTEVPYNNPTSLFTGIKPWAMDNRYGFGGSFAVRNVQPLPMSILSIAPLVEIQS